jgi:hypothetical protein
MKGTATELFGRLAEAEELEYAIDAGEYSTLIDLQKALKERVAKMHLDLFSLRAIDAMLGQKSSNDEWPAHVPPVLH